MSKRKKILIVLALVIIGVLIFLFTRTPSHERHWTEDHAFLPTADVTFDSVTLYTVRDWQYSEAEEPISKDWIEKIELNPEEITKVWFVLEPFAAFKAVGHTFLSFEFENGETYSFSVEARREIGEEYSSVLGVLPVYELMYVWGTERDFITRRLLMLNHPVYLYALELTKEETSSLFVTLAEATEELSKEPRFYNTLTANCTNMLAKIINEQYPGRIPYNIAWNMPGFSDSFLYEEGLIPTDRFFATVKADAALVPYKADIASFATSPIAEFSSKLHALVTK